MNTPHVLTAETASHFAKLALSHVEREYPAKLDHVIHEPDDIRSPRELHPVFFGSFDWQSCVHSYWMLATVLRYHGDIAEAEAIRALFDRQLTDVKIGGEVSYAEQPMRAGFERPYGWAWLLMLAAELSRHSSAQGRAWAGAVRPLAKVFVSRFTHFLPKATYPTRVGTHFNSAFAIVLALDYANAMDDKRFGRLLRGRAVSWFTSDADCQAWEPGGDDFLSSALVEAECMRRSLDADLFASWLDRFLPSLARGTPASLFTPAVVSDRSDGKIAHLDGLNLSRAWCWRSVARALPESDGRRTLALEAAGRHLDASLPHVAGDYMGEHWLATFGLLALTA